MTPARRNRRPRPRLAAAGLVALLAGALGTPSRAEVTELVVVDWHTGLAIGGFDPVGYFTNGAPTPGRGNLEGNYARAVWRFENEGNRAAFLASPQVYMPQFGGYDPTAVARGVATAGSPLSWAIVETRLYLFYNAAARLAFLADPKGFLAAAERQWPQLTHKLAP